jgi:hypothetical protein
MVCYVYKYIYMYIYIYIYIYIQEILRLPPSYSSNTKKSGLPRLRVIATYSKVKYEGSGMDTGPNRFRDMRDEGTGALPGILYEYVYLYMYIYMYV